MIYSTLPKIFHLIWSFFFIFWTLPEIKLSEWFSKENQRKMYIYIYIFSIYSLSLFFQSMKEIEKKRKKRKKRVTDEINIDTAAWILNFAINERINTLKKKKSDFQLIFLTDWWIIPHPYIVIFFRYWF